MTSSLATIPRPTPFATKSPPKKPRARSTDRRVILSFVFILFAIHAARMQADGSLVGYIAPAVAVIGDMVLATFIMLAVVDSCHRELPKRHALDRTARVALVSRAGRSTHMAARDSRDGG